MGTSQSSKGPSSNVSLVPPWADDQPQQPLPSPIPGRFRQFRRSMTGYAKTGNKEHLKIALGHYARTSTGGAGIAVRRFGNIIKAGASLFDLLNTGQTQSNEPSLNLKQLSGKTTEEAISIIADTLTPINGDGERIRTSINNALVDALDGITEINLSIMTEDILASVLINFLTENIFLDVILNSGNSLNNANTVSERVEMENDLHELIKVLTDTKVAGKIKDDFRSFTISQITELQRQIIIEVWQEWENYH
jgi:hypothetical protein